MSTDISCLSDTASLRSALTLERADALVRAWKSGIVYASDLIFEEDGDEIEVVVVEETELGTLGEALKVPMTYVQKQQLFRSIVAAVETLYSLGVGHLELSLQTVFVEEQSAKAHDRAQERSYDSPQQIFEGSYADFESQTRHSSRAHGSSGSRALTKAYRPSVCLRAFSISISQRSDLFWYSSPEELFGNDFLAVKSSSDVWALGCLFAEMFASLTPLFQAVDHTEKVYRMLEMLGA
jgi:serine/threonine protein kinase